MDGIEAGPKRLDHPGQAAHIVLCSTDIQCTMMRIAKVDLRVYNKQFYAHNGVSPVHSFGFSEEYLIASRNLTLHREMYCDQIRERTGKVGLLVTYRTQWPASCP